MISYDPETPFGAIVERIYEDAGETLISNLEVGSPQNACALVTMGAGIALVDEFSARSWPPSQLVTCPIAAAPALTVVHRARHAIEADMLQLRRSRFCAPWTIYAAALMVREGFEMGIDAPSIVASSPAGRRCPEPGPVALLALPHNVWLWPADKTERDARASLHNNQFTESSLSSNPPIP